jgi:AcrR family transcriptional regulator
MSPKFASAKRRARAARQKSSPRQRILAVAQDLFYRRGVRAVGVDAIAQAAGSTKMTLYRHFPSKDALTTEWLRIEAEAFERDWETIAKAHRGDARGQLLAWLRYLGEFLLQPDGRGCAIANASIEITEENHPARPLIQQVKTAQRERLGNLCREGGYVDPERLADELFLLFEGARVSIQSVGVNGPASRLGGLVKAIINTHLPV